MLRERPRAVVRGVGVLKTGVRGPQGRVRARARARLERAVARTIARRVFPAPRRPGLRLAQAQNAPGDVRVVVRHVSTLEHEVRVPFREVRPSRRRRRAERRGALHVSAPRHLAACRELGGVSGKAPIFERREKKVENSFVAPTRLRLRPRPPRRPVVYAAAPSSRFRASTYFSAGASVSLSSPPACISSRMSCPPTSSPSTYSCGMVGQSLNVFSTFRRFPLFASSSVSIVS